MKEKKYLSAAIALTIMAAGSSVFAADVADFGDEEVVVTATRTEKREIDIPASTEVITAEQIKDMGAKNAADALSKVNGFTFATMGQMNGSMGTMTSNLTIRGNDNGTLVMVNGNPIVLRGKYDISTIPAESIERIEIVKGGSSVLYGSEAMAGIVNIITKELSQNNIKIGFGNHGKSHININLNADDKLKLRYNIMQWRSDNDVSTTDLNNKNFVGKTHTYYKDAKRENAGFDFKFNDRFTVSYDFLRTCGTYYRVITDIGSINTLGAQVGDMFNSRDDIITQNLFQANYKDDLWNIKAYFNTALTESFGPNYYYQSSNKPTVDIIRTNGFYSDKNLNPYDTRERNTSYGLDIQRNWSLSNKSELVSGVNYQHEMYKTYWTPYQYGTLKTKTKFSPSDYSRNIWAVFAQLDQKLWSYVNKVDTESATLRRTFCMNCSWCLVA
ncbi:TonB-dependent receptor plug domain-containing protein [Anaerovibrio lipolyticus]|uniref:TonB-dependent receptor plug domain-containing protein n=1 Tax=Anaerovibrio lipolyticus TaxID=82374 RepID=UPI000688EA0A|nr:TonB-dependent receptor plug domain-containing protein [Anaerovibrio lipolyticus]